MAYLTRNPSGRQDPTFALQRRRFDIIKEAVPVATLARDLIEEDLGRLRTTGGRIRGYCPICKNGNHSEAFSASLNENMWYCFACKEGGDVITLANLAGGFHSTAAAVAWLADKYGADLPTRPESWYRKQDRQARIRERLEAERREIRRRRLFKYCILPELELVADEDRERETRIAWERFKGLPID